jgi:Fe-S oxidoreductase
MEPAGAERHGRAGRETERVEASESNALQKNRGKVILWDDTFVRYHEPHIGMAAVKVLEALGFEVALVKNRRCCGRPAFSQGNLDAAAKLAKHNIDLLSSL